MNFHTHYGRRTDRVETCIVGVGGFGQTYIAQSLRAPRHSARIAVDRTAEVAAEGLARAGVAPRRIRLCTAAAEARSAFADGDFVAAGSIDIVLDLPFSVLLEATGMPEQGAAHAEKAIAAGRHVVLVSKEVDSVVGPGLAAMARAAGVVVTPVDGDQPALAIALVTWAEVLGLEIISVGKASEYDFVFDAVTGRVSSNGIAADVPVLRDLWQLEAGRPSATIAARGRALAAFPQRAAPDLCELAMVANACGFGVDRADFHAPVARIAEVVELMRPRAEGGLFAGTRCIDVFHCLRRPDEASFAGGVFITVRCHDAASWQMLAEKGHCVSADGQVAMIGNPRHLLGLEAATSVLDAALHGVSGYGDDHRPRLDLVAVATRDHAAGDVLAMGGHHHAITGARPELRPAQALADSTPAPFYLAANRRLARSVKAGDTFLMADLAIDPSSRLLELRQRQDAIFLA